MIFLGDRLKALRKEKGWSQSELAEQISADARQISRYENKKIMPATETIVGIAQVFGVTVDYFINEQTPRKIPFAQDQELLENFEKLSQLSEEDRRCLFHIIDSFITKNKIKSFAEDIK